MSDEADKLKEAIEKAGKIIKKPAGNGGATPKEAEGES